MNSRVLGSSARAPIGGASGSTPGESASRRSLVKLEFVTHASFILEFDGVRIMSDPWLFGSAFNEGWRLICDYRFDMERFRDIDYIWVSHEHPDHFSPPVLKSIREEFRNDITFLYQATKDGKVIDFCRSIGFRTLELPHERPVTLKQGLQVTCGNVPFFDSWLLYDCGGRKVLNINDCVVDGEGVASDISKVVGEVDVLLTQFSYAGWKGNTDDKALRKESAASKLQIMQTQIVSLRPEWTIPFASFCYFSHEENRYHNDHINPPSAAVEAIRESGSKPVLMYPQDEWHVGDGWSNQASLERYASDYDLSKKRFDTSQGVTESALIGAAKAYIDRLYSRNSRSLIHLIRTFPMIGFLRPLDIMVYDLASVYTFSFPHGLVKKDAGPDDSISQYDVGMHSSSLLYVFRFDWGYDTLMVNGRFEASMKNFNKMTKTFSIGTLNNTGRFVSFRLLFDSNFLRSFTRALRNFARRLSQQGA